MKKLILNFNARWLMAVIAMVTIGVGQMWADTYTKITTSTISGLSNGDVVILATENSSAPYEGVTGGTENNSNQTSKYNATVSTTEANWMEFTVTGRTTDKDAWDEDVEVFSLINSSSKYVGQPGDNTFFLTTTTSYIGVFYTNASGHFLVAGSDANERDFCKYVNNGTFYRMYKSTSTSSSGYTHFYAWKKTPSNFTVTYDGNGKTSGSVPVDASSPYAPSSTVTVKANTGDLARTGCTFAGWNTAADGSGTNYAASGSATFTISANTTLYAKWTATVTWVVNGVTVQTDNIVVPAAGKSVTPPSAPNPASNCGQKFMGWTTTNIGAEGIDKANTSAISALGLFTAAPTVTGSTTYYAVFADYAE